MVTAGRVLCENERVRAAADYHSIAHENIQRRRHETAVPCGPGGTIHDYVPWYFAPRSPMLYANYMGNVPSNPDGQGPIVYLVSTVEAVAAAARRFVFTDGHAIMFNSNFYDDLRDLGEIDWPLMSAKYWQAIDTDPDRPRRRQAEFLVHRYFPWDLVQEVAVCEFSRLGAVQRSLQAANHQPTLRVRPAWYF